MAAALRLIERPHLLLTIRTSPYAEKARWALDYYGALYREKTYLPGLSPLAVIAHGGFSTGKADRVSTRFSTPLLVTAEGTRVHDSTKILEWADRLYSRGSVEGLLPSGEKEGAVGALDAHGPPSLLPKAHAPEITRLSAQWHDMLGPHTRRLAYWYLLPHPQMFLEICERNSGKGQTALLRAALPFFRNYLVSNLGITKPRVDKSLGYIQKEFDEVGERLERQGKAGSNFIVGNDFSAADLSFSCMAALAIWPMPWDGFAAWLPPVERLDEDFREIIAKLRVHPAGLHAQRMFRYHRGERGIPGHPAIPTEPPHDVKSRVDDTPPPPGPSDGGPGFTMRKERGA